MTESRARQCKPDFNRAPAPAPSSAIRVWLLDLREIGETLLALIDHHPIVSPDERSWSEPSTTGRAQPDRLATRAALRLLLADAGGTQPFGLPFGYEASGRPATPAGQPAFNVSHSDRLALIAIAAPRLDAPAAETASCPRLGVDIEMERSTTMKGDRRDLLVAAGAALFDHEIGISSQDARLIAAWTCLEALAKARGSGIGRLLTDIGLTAAGARLHSVATVAERTRRIALDEGLRIRRLVLGRQRMQAAIAGEVSDLEAVPAIEHLTAADCYRLCARFASR